jgi:hypothetical protein
MEFFEHLPYFILMIYTFIVANILITIPVIIILYILGSIGLMKIADKLGEKKSWIAWVPVLNLYLIGKLGFSNVVGWLMIALGILSGNRDTNNSIFSFALSILTAISLYKIYSKVSDKAVLMTVFTVLSLGLLTPIFLFSIRNNEVKV